MRGITITFQGSKEQARLMFKALKATNWIRFQRKIRKKRIKNRNKGLKHRR